MEGKRQLRKAVLYTMLLIQQEIITQKKKSSMLLVKASKVSLKTQVFVNCILRFLCKLNQFRDLHLTLKNK